MASLLHILDEEALKTHPTLKFDPQNPSAFLQKDHPNFQQLKEGLTPEQIEILENVTQVDGFEVDGTDEHDDSMEYLDPETGELEKLGSDEFTLDELGFIDPANLKKITMEAFNTERLDHVNNLIQDRYNELDYKQRDMLRTGYVNKMQANNINTLLGGRLYDNVIMESFTQYPTKVNFNLVMEEIDTGKAALAAGGAVIGAAILYKLVKWCLNAWNKNSAASKAIGENIRIIQERKDNLANSSDLIATAQTAFNTAATAFKNANDNNKLDQKTNKKFADLVKRIGSADNLKDNGVAKEFLTALADAKAQAKLEPHFSNLWLSITTNSSVAVGSGQLQVNADFTNKMVAAINACKAICNAAQAKLENIRETATSQTVDSDKDQTYQQNIQVIKAFASSCGYNLNEANFNSSAPEFSTHVLNQIVAKVDKALPEHPSQANFSMFTEETFSVINDEFMNQVTAFGETLKDLGGSEGGMFGIGKKEGRVDVGNDVQRGSRLTEYQKASVNFRGAMNVLRAIHAIRNNVGRGLVAISDSYDFMANSK